MININFNFLVIYIVPNSAVALYLSYFISIRYIIIQQLILSAINISKISI